MLNRQPLGPSQPEGPSSHAMGAINDELSLAAQAADLAMAFPDVIQHAPKPKNQTWRWLLVSLLSCCAAGGMAVGAFVWLINLPPTANCENSATLTTNRAELYCAQVAAETGELEDVINSLELIGSWDSSHPLHYEVQPLVERWSWVALQAAQDKLLESDMDGAIELINKIPQSSPVYETAQESLKTWNTEWEQGEAIWAEAQEALKRQDWGTASKQVMALSELDNRHWRITQVQELSQQIRVERQAQRQLAEAIELASPGGSDRLGSAIRQASQIDASTYARQTAQAYLDRWSDLLLKLGQDKWYAAELDEAIAIGQNVAFNESRAKVAQELIWISQARKLARQSLSNWRTSPKELAQLYQAMMLANRVSADSPYHPQAQSSIATWKTHLNDLTQLQVAQMAGRVQTLDTLKLAVARAQKVPMGHPRRIQAQTLMAHWGQQIERLEDRPILMKARRLAADETLEAYQAAIQMASQIPLNRALRSEAQSWIYVWESAMETIQDQPLLDAAGALAADGKLSQAIAEASNIRSGRALYDEAQASIAQWRRQIQSIEQSRQRKSQGTSNQRQEPIGNLEDDGGETSELDRPVDVTSERRSRPPSEDSRSQPATQTAEPAPAPVEVQRSRPRSNPLPDRIDTVPAEAAPSRPAPPPIETEPPRRPVIPSPPSSNQAPTPLVAPTAPPAEATTPSPVNAPPPVVAPVPIPAAVPQPSISVPVAPAPQPIDTAPPASTDANVPQPTPAAKPQATRPGAPSVSTRPQPEQTTHLQSSASTEVLFTGALYV